MKSSDDIVSDPEGLRMDIEINRLYFMMYNRQGYKVERTPGSPEDGWQIMIVKSDPANPNQAERITLARKNSQGQEETIELKTRQEIVDFINLNQETRK